MVKSKLGKYLVVAALMIIGIWVIVATPSGPAQEGVVRQQALAALAPAPVGQIVQPETVSQEVAFPTEVNLADIPAGVYDPDNQYDRWLRGEIDIENEGMLSEEEVAALQKEALALPASDAVQQADGTLAPNAPVPGVGFDSIDYTECCGGGGNVPPDPEMAAGPNHVIAVVNVAFEIYNTSGTSLVGPTTFSSFMNADSNCTGVFDPNVLYDEEADRFLLGIDADGDYYCLAVSQTGDPTGSWNLYSFFASSNFFDYPHAGVGRDAIYMGSNIFSGSFIESKIFAFDKWAMYNGQAANAVSLSLANSEDTPQPVNLHGYAQGTWPTSGPHYFITETNFNGDTYSIFSWSDPFGANTLSNVGTVNLTAATGVAAGFPLSVPQSGGSTIQANDYRPQDFEYRNGYAWTVNTISCNPGSGSVNCIRWAQINPATASVVDAGVYASNGDYRFFGDLAVNACDDMAVGYTKSNSSMFPAIYVTGRESGDAAGTLGAESVLKAGEISYTAFDSVPRRWGDYTGMTIAPDGQTFWYLGEYSKDTGTTSGRWGTYIGSFSYPDCDPGGPLPTSTPSPSPTSDPGGDTIHIGDLDGSSTSAPRGGKWNAFVTAYVHDTGDNPVANATVSGSWNNRPGSSCVTDVSGQCEISKSNLNGNLDDVTFRVDSVTLAGSTYDAGANHDPDGDSDGTTILVSQPGVGPTPTPSNTPTATSTAPATSTPSPTPSPTPSNTPEPGDVVLHVGDLDGFSEPAPRGSRWNAFVTITVHDASGNLIANATVSSNWNNRPGPTCVTDAIGQCEISKSNLNSNLASVTFMVTDVTIAGGTYDAGANHDPDLDSDGTSIDIAQP